MQLFAALPRNAPVGASHRAVNRPSEVLRVPARMIRCCSPRTAAAAVRFGEGFPKDSLDIEGYTRGLGRASARHLGDHPAAGQHDRFRPMETTLVALPGRAVGSRRFLGRRTRAGCSLPARAGRAGAPWSGAVMVGKSGTFNIRRPAGSSCCRRRFRRGPGRVALAGTGIWFWRHLIRCAGPNHLPSEIKPPATRAT